jgi:hypothetical protein
MPYRAPCVRCGNMVAAYCCPSAAWLAEHPQDVGAGAHTTDARLDTHVKRGAALRVQTSAEEEQRKREELDAFCESLDADDSTSEIESLALSQGEDAKLVTRVLRGK